MMILYTLPAADHGTFLPPPSNRRYFKYLPWIIEPTPVSDRFALVPVQQAKKSIDGTMFCLTSSHRTVDTRGDLLPHLQVDYVAFLRECDPPPTVLAALSQVHTFLSEAAENDGLCATEALGAVLGIPGEEHSPFQPAFDTSRLRHFTNDPYLI